MAHIVSDEIFRPGFESQPVTTETNEKLSTHTYEEIIFALKLLAYNNSNYAGTSAQLEQDYGVKIHSTTLRNWTQRLFTQKYVEIQHELEQQINKKLGRQLIDLAEKSMRAQDEALDKTLDHMGQVDNSLVASSIAKNVSKTTADNIERAALIEQKPTQIVEHRNPDEALEWLRKRGLLKEKEDVIDAEVVDEE